MDAVQRREPPVPPRPVLVCVDPAGHFLSVGLFRNSQLVFLLERQSIGYRVHHTRGCEVPGRLTMWRAVRNTYIRVICVHEIPSIKVLAGFSPKDSALGALLKGLILFLLSSELGKLCYILNYNLKVFLHCICI